MPCINTLLCPICEKVVPRDQIEYINPDSDRKLRVCASCASKAEMCDECGGHFTADMITSSKYEDKQYCRNCFYETHNMCVLCKQFFLKENLEYFGTEQDPVCKKCYPLLKDCETCGKKAVKLYNIENTDVCYDCALALPECFLCSDRTFDKGDVGLCSRCISSFFVQAFQHVSVQAVRTAYPDLEKRISNVFGTSLHNRDDSKDLPHFEKEIKRVFGDRFDIDFVNLVYVDKEHPSSSKPLSKLSSTSFAKEKDAAEWLHMMVSALYNKKRDRDGFIEREVPHAVKNIITALRYRMYMLSNDEKLRYALDTVVGFHDLVLNDVTIRKDIFFFFSTDPVDIFSKSTGRAWEETSCEKYRTSDGGGGSYGNGIYSDIMHANIVVYLVNKKGEALARVMLRWCKQDDEKNKWGLGIESVWYNQIHQKMRYHDSNTEIVPRFNHSDIAITANILTTCIEHILRINGLYSYDYCETPYEYAGYSDVEGQGHTGITYNGRRA